MWVAGWNMPGYLPEMEPITFNDRRAADDFIIMELRSQADGCEDDGDFLAFDTAAHSFGGAVMTTDKMPDGYVYWVREGLVYR